MTNTSTISKAFNYINSQILKITEGKLQLCDYGSFDDMLETWVTPSSISKDEVEEYIKNFHGFIQYGFSEELEDIEQDLQLIAQCLSQREQDRSHMSDYEIEYELMTLSVTFQNMCESVLYNIRLKLGESECYIYSEK
jgi:hypothetical protein